MLIQNQKHPNAQKYLSKTVCVYLFLMGAENPKASEVINLSMGKPVPANAHAPRGQKFILKLESSDQHHVQATRKKNCGQCSLL
jgi:methyl coenzyme M reductase subunit C